MVWVRNVFLKYGLGAQIIFLVAIFYLAHLWLFIIFFIILLSYVFFYLYPVGFFYRDTEIVKQQTKKFICLNYEFTFTKHQYILTGNVKNLIILFQCACV